jgi:hypothetical protein
MGKFSRIQIALDGGGVHSLSSPVILQQTLSYY